MYLLLRYHGSHQNRPGTRSPLPIDKQGSRPVLRLMESIEPGVLLDIPQLLGANEEFLRRWVYYPTVNRLLLIVITILMVELTLALNTVGNVNDLTSTGQLVAFIVSVGGCITLAMQVGVEDPRKEFTHTLYGPGATAEARRSGEEAERHQSQHCTENRTADATGPEAETGPGLPDEITVVVS